MGEVGQVEDRFHRHIDYLRVSVTDRCNLRCRYCMPEEGIPLKKHEDILRLEEIAYLVSCAVDMGVRKVRLTGGEPLVRKKLLALVSHLAAIPEIEDLSLTTNGLLLGQYAGDLKQAGLKRVNISLDTMDADRYRYITRGGDVARVLAGIKAAQEAGLEPIKINTVVVRGFNEDEVVAFARMAQATNIHVRFIELMPIGEGMAWGKEAFVPNDEVLQVLEKEFKLRPTLRADGNGPACYYALPGSLGTVGFISALSHVFCHQCNRMRLTAEGCLRPCLQSDVEVDLKKALREGQGREAIQELFRQALKLKPWRHTLDAEGWLHQRRRMCEIGG